MHDKDFCKHNKICEEKDCATHIKTSQDLIMSSEPITKALPKSISFSPGQIYIDAQAWGAEQQRAMNVSEVVSLFVQEGLVARGYPKSRAENSSKVLLAICEKLIAHGATLQEVEEALDPLFGERIAQLPPTGT